MSAWMVARSALVGRSRSAAPAPRPLAQQAATLRAALRDRPTKAERATIQADIKVQLAKLGRRKAA